MKAWLIERRINSIVKLRGLLGDAESPPDAIEKPKYMRTVGFNNKIKQLKWLEKDLERLLLQALSE